MTPVDYPVDVRADYPERSSRGWAVLTILLIKFIALIPHFIVLAFLGIAQFVVAFIAQFVVAFKGEYPEGMHDFVTGVLRWGTRVLAFAFSLNDRYPPFTLKPVDAYPLDVVVERPRQSSRAYAAFTIVVEFLFIAGMLWLWVWLIRSADTSTWFNQGPYGTDVNYNFQSSSAVGLVLRQIAALPHFIVLLFLGLAAFVLWFIVQWVILFAAVFPRGMHDVVAGYLRWYTRVIAYSLGLIDRYPPFTMSPSLTESTPVAPSWPAAPPPPVYPQEPPPVPRQGPPTMQPPSPSPPQPQAPPPPVDPPAPDAPGQP